MRSKCVKLGSSVLVIILREQCPWMCTCNLVSDCQIRTGWFFISVISIFTIPTTLTMPSPTFCPPMSREEGWVVTLTTMFLPTPVTLTHPVNQIWCIDWSFSPHLTGLLVVFATVILSVYSVPRERCAKGYGILDSLRLSLNVQQSFNVDSLQYVFEQLKIFSSMFIMPDSTCNFKVVFMNAFHQCNWSRQLG